MPEELMLAIEEFVMPQIPLPTVSINATAFPGHVLSIPEIVPTSGKVFTVTSMLVSAVPQVLLTAKLIVSIPADTPETTPPETVAELLLLYHIPPVIVSNKVIVELTQT